MTSIRRLIAVMGALALGALATVLIAGPASAASCPVGDPGLGGCTATVAVGSTSPTQGSTDTAGGTGMRPGSTVTITVCGETVATTTADAGGDYAASFTIPTDCGTGAKMLTASDTFGTSASSEITILASAAGSGSGSGSGSGLASTGVAVIGIGALAVILLAGGGAMLFVGRRRPTSSV